MGQATSPAATPGAARVLVVEDDPAITGLLRLRLTQAGYDVVHAGTGPEALAAVPRVRPAVILLDIGLPGLDGIEVCRRLRGAGDWTPIVFLTARDDEVDRVVGLELGADDYVTKPFSPREVLARVGALLRRAAVVDAAAAPGQGDRASGGAGSGSGVLLVKGVALDAAARTASVDGVPIELTAREFDLLAYLLASPGRVYTRPHLLREVWGSDYAAGPRTVDVHVAQVRAKLGERATVLRTVRGVGYAAGRGGGGA